VERVDVLGIGSQELAIDAFRRHEIPGLMILQGQREEFGGRGHLESIPVAGSVRSVGRDVP
jgi:hypothetical protein